MLPLRIAERAVVGGDSPRRADGIEGDPKRAHAVRQGGCDRGRDMSRTARGRDGNEVRVGWVCVVERILGRNRRVVGDAGNR